MDRPYMQMSGRELKDLADEHWEHFSKLGTLAYEMQFRRYIDEEVRAAVVERLVELGRRRMSNEGDEPGFDFPTTDVLGIRKNARASLEQVDWRKIGLLRMSGYRVGATSGKPEGTRRRILNAIFLKDDLRDVDDEAYRSLWGRPMTSKRLQKLSETIAAFARNAKKNPINSYERAIAEWEADLRYLKDTFYDRWGDFPWPDVEV